MDVKTQMTKPTPESKHTRKLLKCSHKLATATVGRGIRELTSLRIGVSAVTTAFVV